jgi:hypothetical protein
MGSPRAGHGFRGENLFWRSQSRVRDKRRDGNGRHGKNLPKIFQEKNTSSGFTMAPEPST